MTEKADKVAHGTRSRGERNGRAKLTEREVTEIRELYAGGSGWSYRELAFLYGVSQGLIGRIVNRKMWKHL